MDPKITILIRTHPGREQSVLAAEFSVHHQQYTNVHVELFYGEKTPGYEYNLYCNELKSRVEDGWFFFLDSDDQLVHGALHKLAPHLIDPDEAVIVQMIRVSRGHIRSKPVRDEIARGKIGMPCMILHAKHKDLADVTATEDGDYQWIKAVTDKLKWKFVPIPVVNAGRRGHGK